MSVNSPTGGAAHFGYRVRQYLMGLPGKRGIDIPEARYDHLFNIAAGITQPIWGMFPTPEHMQHLHDHDLDTAEKQHSGLFGQFKHPRARSLTVSEYQSWKQAHQVVKMHGAPR
jgi:hypothetical protein